MKLREEVARKLCEVNGCDFNEDEESGSHLQWMRDAGAAIAAVLDRAARELAMTKLMNSEASDQWLAGFQHAESRIRNLAEDTIDEG